jgi:subtilisin family serine protease
VNQENAPWGLARLSSTGPVTGPNPVYTYRAEASGAGVTVYIIDTGINEKHVEFENRARKGPNFIEDSNGLISSNNDIIGHGTHVAGTIGGKEYGVAKSVNLVGIKVFNDHTGTATTIDIIRALEWVVNQVPTNGSPKAVVNLSLGGGSSPAMDAAVAATVRKGIVVVVAAGNDGGRVTHASFPDLELMQTEVDADTTSPAREPLAITVGAIDNKDMRASFSNYGRKIDIFAPGVNILSAWIAKPGETPTNKENKEIQGTSMGMFIFTILQIQGTVTDFQTLIAAPHVAGVAVSVLSDKNQKGIINPQDVIGAILINADKGGVGNIPSPARFTTIAAIAKV